MKRTNTIFALVLGLLLASVQGFAAATCTSTPIKSRPGGAALTSHGEMHTCAWTSDGSGAATGSLTMRGLVTRVETVPSSGAAPTDDYDITCVGPNGTGLDIFGGALANRDTSNTEQVPTPNSGITVLTYFNGTCTFTVSNAGATKAGTAYIYVVNP